MNIRVSIAWCFILFLLISIGDSIVYELVERDIWGWRNNRHFIYLISEILIVCTVCVSLKVKLGLDWRSYIGLNNFQLMHIVYALFVSLCIFIVHKFIFNELQTQISDSYKSLDINQIVPYSHLLLIIIVKPISEEIIFRGLLLSPITEKYNVYLATILTSSLWALIHIEKFPIFGLIYLLIVGAILCFTRFFLKSLFPSIMIHMLINGMVIWYWVLSKYDLVW